MLLLQKVRRFNWVPVDTHSPSIVFFELTTRLRTDSTKAELKEIGIVNFFKYGPREINMFGLKLFCGINVFICLRKAF